MTRPSLGGWAAIVTAALPLTIFAADDSSRRLDDQQRTRILSLIKAVDAAQASGTARELPADAWTAHMLKSTTGMNYVPMTINLDVPGAAGRAVVVYLRVVVKGATNQGVKSVLERWVVNESVKAAPAPAPFRGFVSINPEEMPVGLAVSSSRVLVREPAAHSMALMLNEQQEKQAAEARDRTAKGTREAQEGSATEKGSPRDEFVYPFEDFGFTAGADGAQSGSVRLEHAIAVPPGEYDLYVAAVAQTTGRSDPSPSVVYRSSLSVPSFDRAELLLSSVIVAERLETLATPYSPEDQASHPYALGWTQVIPSPDTTFTDKEQLAVVFQVLNPLRGAEDKPDVTVKYNFHMAHAAGEPVTLTARHDFNARTLPAEFDLERGHQVFAAQAVPLETFAPGGYRLQLEVTDNVARRTISRELDVFVRATDDSLWLRKTVDDLLAPSFRRNQVLSPSAVAAALDELAGYEPIASTLTPAVAAARDGRHAAVLGMVPASTDVASSFLRGLALMSLGENLDPAAREFREALRHGSDFMPATLYLGACLAANGRDREAMAAWQLVTATDTPSPAASELLADAFLRARQPQKAVEVLTEASARWADEPGIERRLAAAHMMAGQRDEALAALERLLGRRPDDLDALFLASYLLKPARGGAPPVDPAGAEKLRRYARTYLTAGGPHQAMVEQWLSDGGAK